MIIDVHGHYTTAPRALKEYRERQISAFDVVGAPPLKPDLTVSDDEIRESIEENQLRIQKERGIDVTIFSPPAGGMGHHIGTEITSLDWTQASNDMISRVCNLYPENFVGVCQLPQSPGVSPANCVEELSRCVEELGFIGCNINPDPSDGFWTGPAFTDRYWYPLFEKMVELDVPAMVHVSQSCNENFHHTGAHYLNADTSVFMQLVLKNLFEDFPTLRLVIPHGGGAVPYHWGRYRGLAQDKNRPLLTTLLKNIFFDTCVYHQHGMELLLKTVPGDNILFASEIIGAVRGVDPETGHNYDDTKRYIDNLKWLDETVREKVFSENAFKVYPRLRDRLQNRALVEA
ncbi:amidohydrolase family protein [Caballeronia sp. 15711]|uniref:amidohydrolase family protein n=1 Tax=Caballeronia sp. 15711 TaxID=3391029 RepID=UPI0039E34A2C